MRQAPEVPLRAIPDIPLGPTLTAEQAARIFDLGKEAVIFALLQQAQMLAQQLTTTPANDSPAKPSGMQAPYEKPARKSRHKRPGQKPGHPGHRRSPPERIDRREEHRLKACPDCGGPLRRSQRTRTRYVEDIPDDLQPVVTAHTIHRDWCPRCRKSVEPVVPDALPGSMLGNHVLVLSAWLHYALGNTLAQIVEVFQYHLHLPLTPGGLVQQWQRLQAILEPWYEQIRQEGLHAAVLHADETSWRVLGKTRWLWCFATADLTYFLIDRARGSPALRKFFTEEFCGTLVTDFWGAYNKVVCARRQLCLVHLLRDFLTVEKYKSPGPHWAPFAKKVKRLVRDAMRLSRRDDLSVEQYASRRACLDARLQAVLDTPWEDGQARRLLKRLRRHQRHLFTFLDQPDVPFDNNHGERSIRPAVLIRKNSYCNRSDNGARTQAVLMSIYRTLKQRGHDPINTVCQAIADYLTTGKLPPLPKTSTANS